MTATVSGFSSMWPAPLLLVLSVFTGAIQAQDPGPTTVPVFLPAYKPQDWSSLRGSIVTSVCSILKINFTIYLFPLSGSLTHSLIVVNPSSKLLTYIFAKHPERRRDSIHRLLRAKRISNIFGPHHHPLPNRRPGPFHVHRGTVDAAYWGSDRVYDASLSYPNYPIS